MLQLLAKELNKKRPTTFPQIVLSRAPAAVPPPPLQFFSLLLEDPLWNIPRTQNSSVQINEQ